MDSVRPHGSGANPSVWTFKAGADTARAPLVLFHGSEGNESDLLPIADELAPEAAKLAPRGTVPTGVGYAFVTRFPDRRVDEKDLAARTPALAESIATACNRYNLSRRPVAIGFSSGAIMSAALLMTDSSLLAAAILFRPLVPFSHKLTNRLDGTPVLTIDGATDHRRTPGDGRRVAEQLRDLGAHVTHHVLPVGHSITAEDTRIAREWLEAHQL